RVVYLDPGTGALATNDLPVAAGTTFQFPANTVPANSGYTLGIKSQPAGQRCTIRRGAGFALGPTVGPAVVNNLDATCVANANPTPLTGTYTLLDGDGRKYFNFNADGTLTVVLASNDPDCGDRQGNGIEYGAFSWNQATGAVHLFDPPSIDTNGGCGFWE